MNFLSLLCAPTYEFVACVHSSAQGVVNQFSHNMLGKCWEISPGAAFVFSWRAPPRPETHLCLFPALLPGVPSHKPQKVRKYRVAGALHRGSRGRMLVMVISQSMSIIVLRNRMFATPNFFECLFANTLSPRQGATRYVQGTQDTWACYDQRLCQCTKFWYVDVIGCSSQTTCPSGTLLPPRL